MKKYTVIDLFSGAGGLSEGFHQTGSFDFLAHVEWKKPMVETLRNNLIKRLEIIFYKCRSRKRMAFFIDLLRGELA